MEHRRVDRLLQVQAEVDEREEEDERPLVLLVAARRAEGEYGSPSRQRQRRARASCAAACRGASELGRPSSSQNICARVPRQKPRPGMTGEPCSQPPLGVAETMLPKRSTTSTWQVSPRGRLAALPVGSPVAPRRRVRGDACGQRAARGRRGCPGRSSPDGARSPTSAAPLVGVAGAQQRRPAARRRPGRRTRPRGRRTRAWRTRRPCGRSRRRAAHRARSKPSSSASCCRNTGPWPHGPVLQTVSAAVVEVTGASSDGRRQSQAQRRAPVEQRPRAREPRSPRRRSRGRRRRAPPRSAPRALDLGDAATAGRCGQRGVAEQLARRAAPGR